MPQTLLKTKSTADQEPRQRRCRRSTPRSPRSPRPPPRPRKPDVLGRRAKATSSSTRAATVTATPPRRPATLTFTRRAGRHRPGHASPRPYPDDNTLVPAIPPAVTVKKADGTLVTVTPTTGSLADIAKAINDAADSGVKATVVRVSGGATPQYRLQFTGHQHRHGRDLRGLRRHDGRGHGGRDPASTPPRSPRAPRTPRSRSGRASPSRADRHPVLEHVHRPDDRRRRHRLQGHRARARTPSPSPWPGTTRRSRSSPPAWSASLGVVLSEITSRTAITTKTNADGTTTRHRRPVLRRQRGPGHPASSWSPRRRTPVGGVLPVRGRHHRSARTARSPSTRRSSPRPSLPTRRKVQSIVTHDRRSVSPRSPRRRPTSTTGTLTLKITGQESLVKDMGTQIENWDRRLELRREGLAADLLGARGHAVQPPVAVELAHQPARQPADGSS